MRAVARSVAALLLAIVALSVASDALAAQRPVLAGRWKMTFRTTYEHGFGGPPVGSRYTRTWIFERSCRSGRCDLVARRETATDGFIRLRVHRSGSVYRVTWKTRPRCGSGTGRFRYSETITFTPTRTVTIGGRRYAARVAGRLVGRSPAWGCQTHAAEGRDRLTGRRTDLPVAPRAAFSSAPSQPSVTAGSGIVYFTDESTDDDGRVVRRSWDFGDLQSAENVATGEQPSHAYGAPGTYRVLLTVTDDDGLRSTAERFVTVLP